MEVSMFISKDEAVSMAQARHKVKTCRAGQGWLICPYMPGARYSKVHYVPELEKSVQCDDDACHYHYLPLVSKAHVPALVNKKPQTIVQCEAGALEAEVLFRGEHWSARIVEITAGCLKYLLQDSRPDQLAVVYRKGPRNNGPLSFKWLDSVLKGVPPHIASMAVEEILPAVIYGQYRNAAEVALDNSVEGPIKHKINSLPLQSAQSDCTANLLPS